MFLYFLQRKGWMTFGGSEQYFEALWADTQSRNDGNFYETRLRLLFFTALSNEQSANFNRAGVLVADHRQGAIP